MILRLPGVYPPQHDTSLLADALLFERLTARSRVLDLCTGTGALAVAASAAGAGHVVAVDIISPSVCQCSSQRDPQRNLDRLPSWRPHRGGARRTLRSGDLQPAVRPCSCR